MNTSDFVREYAEQYGVAIQAADAWVRTILEYLSECIVSHDEVKLAKFGVFKHGYVPATGYTDFQTGEWKTSKPKMTVKFTMGKQMEAAMKDVPVSEDLVKKARHKSEIPMRKKKNENEADASDVLPGQYQMADCPIDD